jgi:hypothetical protein
VAIYDQQAHINIIINHNTVAPPRIRPFPPLPPNAPPRLPSQTKMAIIIININDIIIVITNHSSYFLVI